MADNIANIPISLRLRLVYEETLFDEQIFPAIFPS